MCLGPCRWGCAHGDVSVGLEGRALHVTSPGPCPRQPHSCDIWWGRIAVPLVQLDQEIRAQSGPRLVIHIGELTSAGLGSPLSQAWLGQWPEAPDSRSCPWSALPLPGSAGETLWSSGGLDLSSVQESRLVLKQASPMVMLESVLIMQKAIRSSGIVTTFRNLEHSSL